MAWKSLTEGSVNVSEMFVHPWWDSQSLRFQYHLNSICWSHFHLAYLEIPDVTNSNISCFSYPLFANSALFQATTKHISIHGSIHDINFKHLHQWLLPWYLYHAMGKFWLICFLYSKDRAIYIPKPELEEASRTFLGWGFDVAMSSHLGHGAPGIREWKCYGNVFLQPQNTYSLWKRIQIRPLRPWRVSDCHLSVCNNFRTSRGF